MISYLPSINLYQYPLLIMLCTNTSFSYSRFSTILFLSSLPPDNFSGNLNYFLCLKHDPYFFLVLFLFMIILPPKIPSYPPTLQIKILFTLQVSPQILPLHTPVHDFTNRIYFPSFESQQPFYYATLQSSDVMLIQYLSQSVSSMQKGTVSYSSCTTT